MVVTISDICQLHIFVRQASCNQSGPQQAAKWTLSIVKKFLGYPLYTQIGVYLKGQQIVVVSKTIVNLIVCTHSIPQWTTIIQPMYTQRLENTQSALCNPLKILPNIRNSGVHIIINKHFHVMSCRHKSCFQ